MTTNRQIITRGGLHTDENLIDYLKKFKEEIMEKNGDQTLINKLYNLRSMYLEKEISRGELCCEILKLKYDFIERLKR